MSLFLPTPPTELIDAYGLASVPSFFVNRAIDHTYVEVLDRLSVEDLCAWLDATADTRVDHTIVSAVTVSLAKRGAALPERVSNRDWMLWIWASTHGVMQRREEDT